jgi:hypothetical protein
MIDEYTEQLEFSYNSGKLVQALYWYMFRKSTQTNTLLSNNSTPKYMTKNILDVSSSSIGNRK